MDGAEFIEDSWQREGGGGRSRVLRNGGVFEQAGVKLFPRPWRRDACFRHRSSPGDNVTLSRIEMKSKTILNMDCRHAKRGIRYNTSDLTFTIQAGMSTFKPLKAPGIASSVLSGLAALMLTGIAKQAQARRELA